MGLLSTSIPGRATNLARRRNKRHLSWLLEPLRRTSTRHQNLTLADLRGKAGNPGVLSRRQPGLWRSGGALQRDPPGVPQARCGTVGYFGRRGLVPCGLCPRPPLAFSLRADFEPKGEVARKYRAYRASEGVYERALLVPDRQGTDCMELLLADRGQSRRRWNS
jgi:hypothetical protein